MKRIIYLEIALLLLFSCKPKTGVKFCEGVSPEGKEINCGTVFSEGDITILIESEKSFETDKIKIEIFENTKPVKKRIDTFSVDVKPESKTTKANLSLYNEGIYKIEVTGKEGERIANGTVQIVESY